MAAVVTIPLPDALGLLILSAGGDTILQGKPDDEGSGGGVILEAADNENGGCAAQMRAGDMPESTMTGGLIQVEGGGPFNGGNINVFAGTGGGDGENAGDVLLRGGNHATPSHKGLVSIQYTEATPNYDSRLQSGALQFIVDETAHTLTIRVKYNGVGNPVKVATLPLT